MKPTQFCSTAAALALLAACSGGEETAADGVEAGQWNFTIQVTDVEAPELAPEQLQAMLAQQQQSQSMSQCFTEAQARNLDTSTAALSGNDDCEFSESSFADGEIRVRGSCDIPNAPQPATLEMDGGYDRTSMNIDMRMVMAESPIGPMTTHIEMTGTHEGECQS